MSDSPSLVLLTNVAHLGLAYVIRSMLEEHEVDCFVFDDNSAGAGFATQDIRIMVSSDDLEVARDLLIALEKEHD